ITGTIATTTVEGCNTSAAPAAATTVAQLEAMGLSISYNCTSDAALVVSHADVANGTCPIVITRTYTVKDACLNGSTAVHSIKINDTTRPITTITGPASGSVYPVGTTVNFTATFTDACGAQSCQWTFDTITQSAPVSGTSGLANTSYKFTTAGVYMV